MERPYTPLAIDPSHLVLAIPKKGRLYEQSIKLLNEIGLQYKRSSRSDIAHCTAAPISLVFLNVVDIPVFVAEGNVDGGIVGQDVIEEAGCEPAEQQLLGFGNCTLVVQAPRYLHFKPEDLIGKRVVTSFPRLTRRFFAALEAQQRQAQCVSHDGKSSPCQSTCCEQSDVDNVSEHPFMVTTMTDDDAESNLKTRVLAVSGSVEASVSLGLSEGVVDLVETGDTMRIAGLEQIAVLMKSEAVFISNPNARHHTWLTIIRKRIGGYLTAQRYQMVTYNIQNENLMEAMTLTPGLRSPTVTYLANLSWSSVTAVVERPKVLEIIDKLDALGARDILAYNFKHCRIGQL